MPLLHGGSALMLGTRVLSNFPTFHLATLSSPAASLPRGQRQMAEPFQASQTRTPPAKRGISSRQGSVFREHLSPKLSYRSCWPGSGHVPIHGPTEGEGQILAFSASVEGGLLQQESSGRGCHWAGPLVPFGLAGPLHGSGKAGRSLSSTALA